jgi:hypothetical protein
MSASPFWKCASASGDFVVAVIVALEVAAGPADVADEGGGGGEHAVSAAAATTKSTRFM